ncbi:MAG: hypothetical protein WDN45_01125 [Caulobacteraceae bacterium]
MLIVNAAICGILSGPFARYQSRLIWLLPIGAGLTACALPMGFERLIPAAKGLWERVAGLWEQVRAQPVIGRFLPPLNGHFMRFCCVAPWLRGRLQRADHDRRPWGQQDRRPAPLVLGGGGRHMGREPPLDLPRT